MALMVVVLVASIAVVGFRVLDRYTDAAVMRRDVNAGTRWWRVAERLRRAEDPIWPSGPASEHEGGINGPPIPRSRRRRTRTWRN